MTGAPVRGDPNGKRFAVWPGPRFLDVFGDCSLPDAARSPKGEPVKMTTTLLALIAVSMCAAAFAKSPFDGTWNLDTSKSNAIGQTFSVQDAGHGALKYADSQESYTVKLDGGPVTTPLGEVVTMQRTGDDSYSFTSKRGGKLSTDERWKLSPDGTTLTIDWRTFQPNGKIYHSEEIDAKTSPGTGLIGTWKVTKLSTDLLTVLTIQTTGMDDVTVTLPVGKARVHGKWDGRDYPYRGPTIPAGTTVAFTRAGARGFNVVMKLKGRVMQTLSFAVTADGRSMVEVSTNDAGKKQPGREVWNKQS